MDPLPLGQIVNKYTALKETALINFDKLLDYWQLNYQKISDTEYDFINPSRDDSNFGACRFNTKKGIGADFAGSSFTEQDFNKIGIGFTKEDFIGLGETGASTNWGFDVIGLCGRLYKISDYKESAARLIVDLKEIEIAVGIINLSKKDIEKKEQLRELAQDNKIKYAAKTFAKCLPIEGTDGEKYFRARAISKFSGYSIKYHPAILNKESGKHLPTILFPVRVGIRGDDDTIQAIHRIYLSERSERKAVLQAPKMALGPIKGAGIWFADMDQMERLYIAEGPENALSILSMGRGPVVSTINATNFSNLSIPNSVKIIILCPDNDKAGIYNSKKALKAYQKNGRIIKIALPPPGKDFNDLLMEGLKPDVR